MSKRGASAGNRGLSDGAAVFPVMDAVWTKDRLRATIADMNEASKFARYRARKKAQGLRQVRMWVPDVSAPGFQAQLNRAVAAINASDEEAEILRWCEAAAAEVWNSED